MLISFYCSSPSEANALTSLSWEKSKENSGSLVQSSPHPRHLSFPSLVTCDPSVEQTGTWRLYARLILQPCPMPLLDECFSHTGKTMSIEPSRSASPQYTRSDALQPRTARIYPYLRTTPVRCPWADRRSSTGRSRRSPCSARSVGSDVTILAFRNEAQGLKGSEPV